MWQNHTRHIVGAAQGNIYQEAKLILPQGATYVALPSYPASDQNARIFVMSVGN
jgi:hypothetical protein